MQALLCSTGAVQELRAPGTHTRPTTSMMMMRPPLFEAAAAFLRITAHSPSPQLCMISCSASQIEAPCEHGMFRQRAGRLKANKGLFT
jgi:hypothetical protein